MLSYPKAKEMSMIVSRICFFCSFLLFGNSEPDLIIKRFFFTFPQTDYTRPGINKPINNTKKSG